MPANAASKRSAAFSDFEGVGRAFARAAANGTYERCFVIAGKAVALRFAGDALLEQLTPALDHLAADAAHAELVINVWDSETTATPPPPLPAVGGGAFGSFYYDAEPPHRLLYQPERHAISVLDTERNEAWYWIASPRDLNHWETAAPARHILQWVIGRQVHGGAVGTAEGGALLVGSSGSGKSTAALSALDSGLLYAGDDFVVLEDGAEPHVHSLYSSGQLPPGQVERLPHLRHAVANPRHLDSEKAVVYVHRHWPERTTSGFPLRAVLVSKIVPERRESRVTSISPAAALAAVGPSTVLLLRPSGQEALAALARLVQQVPTYVLELGTDIQGISPALSVFLEAQ